MIEEVIPSALAGERLDRIVALLADISRSDATATLENDGVRVDGVLVHSGKERLTEGCTVSVDVSKIPVPAPPEADSSVEFTVVHQDDDIIVVDKPPGLVVHPGPGHARGTLVNGLLDRFPEIGRVGQANRPGVVHRLDQGTSGLLIIARTEASYVRLVEMLSRHDVKRRYLAVLWGWPEAEEFTVDAPVGRDPRDPLRMTVLPTGKDARTHMVVLRRYQDPEMALVQCDLETGRTHQIRVHARAIGHPVIGDSTYGGVRSGVRTSRPLLHAQILEFDHPSTGEQMKFESPMPEDIRLFLEGRTPAC